MIKSLKMVFVMILLSGSCFSQNKPVVSLTDKTFNLYIDYHLDTPTIWGYQSPDLASKKSICFSSETSIVEGNQSKCILGCYYETTYLDIEYVGVVGVFVELKFKKEGNADVLFYVQKTDVRIEN